MPEATVIASIADVPRASWDACFPGQIETYDYLLAVERAEMPGFRWRPVIFEENGRPIAAIPGFWADYPLDTMVTGPGRCVLGAARRAFPEILTLKLACLGSPCTETAGLGFLPSVLPARRPDLLRAMIAAFERSALEEGAELLAIKDVPACDRPLYDSAAHALGYREVPSLPIATLEIDFDDLDAYLARLSRETRKDLRRKLRAFQHVRVEVRSNLSDVLDAVLALYRDTLSRAAMRFEELTPRFFSGVLELMEERAFCTLFYVGDDLLAANLLLEDGTTLLDKFFCMDGLRGRRYNLYFLSWFTNVRLCLERGLARYQSGQAAYAEKLRLGCSLRATWVYFRHRRRVVSRGLQWLAPHFMNAGHPTSE